MIECHHEECSCKPGWLEIKWVLVEADDVNIMGGSIHTVKEKIYNI